MDSGRAVMAVDAVRGTGPRCLVKIRRVDKHNALSRDVLAAIAAAVRCAVDDSSVAYVVITGEGSRYFAAGGDLVDLAAIRSPDDTVAFANEARDALDAIRTCAIPTIAFLNGDAIGGGAELALACDLRVFAPTARIGYVQSRLAITSAWGGGPDLVAAVGSSRAMRMMMRAELCSADDARRDGLADAIVDGGVDGDAARSFFAPLDATARHVLVAIKANVKACRVPDLEGRAVEQANLVRTWTDDAHWDAVDRVFSSTRKPR